MNPFVGFLLRSVSIVTVILAGVYDFWILGWTPFLVVALYAGWALYIDRDQPARMETDAEQVYFIGYLSTIAAFTSIILRIIQTHAMPEDPFPLLTMGAIALGATVAGLLGMTLLKDRAQSLRTERLDEITWKRQLLDQVRSLNLKSPSQEPPDHETALAQAALNGATSKASMTLENLNKELAELQTTFSEFTAAIRQGKKPAEQFHNHVEQVQSVLDAYIRMVERKLPKDN